MTARRALLLLPVLAATRCGGPPPPAVLELVLNAGPDQNPGPGGRPSPVAVRLYQLKASGAFERADWYALTERERAALGDDAASTEELLLAPGEARSITRELKPGVRYVGAAAGFREIDRAAWRAVQPVPASGAIKLLLRTTANNVTLAPA